jgi:hypothetical protein
LPRVHRWRGAGAGPQPADPGRPADSCSNAVPDPAGPYRG